ncbi:MAG: hypothetical protein OXJ54_07720 [Gemmatimonadetes bacterium]|nr:hypothetical protein [Candidatus Palauibacter rhopaloidicola]
MIIGLAVIFVTVVGGGIWLACVIRAVGEEIRTDTKIASACAEVRAEIRNVRHELRNELRKEITGVRDEMRDARIGFGG